ncbi:MAG: hypothetical protein K2P57_11570 [Burkholderiales bacterium]|nr:hypothetical protein [Burkholderiales bacterium]
MSFGVLTLSTPSDYQKAIGLALSLRISNPGVPIAVACWPPSVCKLLEPYFDHVLEQDPSIKGFEHKVNLDRYSPFQETFFFDSDVLIFKPLSGILDDWKTQPYTACGSYATDGFSAFGLDKALVLKRIGKDRLVQIDGAGHAYFRKPECQSIFDLAREITANYADYAGNIRYADEDVMNIAMTILGLRPMPHGNFFSRHLSAVRGTMDMDASVGRCRFNAVVTGQVQEPHMMHFAAREASFAYTAQLRKLYRRFGVSTDGLLKLALSDFYVLHIKWPFKTAVRNLLGK